MRTKKTTTVTAEDILIGVRNANPEPEIAGDDPHDTGEWQMWREGIDAKIIARLKVAGIAYTALRGDRSSVSVYNGRTCLGHVYL